MERIINQEGISFPEGKNGTITEWNEKARGTIVVDGTPYHLDANFIKGDISTIQNGDTLVITKVDNGYRGAIVLEAYTPAAWEELQNQA